MYIFPCIRIRYIKPIAINTHIDCLNNSKATKQGALKVTLHHFLLLEVKWDWKAYFCTTHQPHPINWKIDKCHDYLLSHPIPISKKADLDLEIQEWKDIQSMINESQEQEDNLIIHHSWSSDIPYLHLYHTLVEDSI